MTTIEQMHHLIAHKDQQQPQSNKQITSSPRSVTQTPFGETQTNVKKRTINNPKVQKPPIVISVNDLNTDWAQTCNDRANRAEGQ